MPPRFKAPQLEDPAPPPDKPDRRRQALRALLGFLHVAVAILLITAAIMVLIFKGSLFVVYDISFALLILIAEIRRRMAKKKAALIDKRLKFFNRIRFRGIFYQICGAIIILSEPRNFWWGERKNKANPIGWTVWGIGVGLLLIGTVARELGCLDWFDDDQDSGKVRLEDSDEDVESLLTSPV